jgi:release factor glutamine methyltransferase
MKVRDLYHALKSRIDALDARLLMCHAMKTSHEEFLLQQDDKLSSPILDAIEGMVVQREKGRPVAKILGHREFYGRRFLTTNDTLDPRPDTETLVEAVLARVKPNQSCRMLDLGTGTGCLLITLLCERGAATGAAVDVSAAALMVARKNAYALGVMDRIDFVESDWTHKIDGQFDVIVSNPPYIASHEIDGLAPDVKAYDPMGALDGGVDGLEAYRIIIGDLSRILAPSGLVAFEVGHTQSRQVGELLTAHRFKNVIFVKDLAGIERVVLANRA